MPPHSTPSRSRLVRFLYENSLLLVVVTLALASLSGQAATGKIVNDEERAHDGLAPLDAGEYLTSGHFLEATFENWESEFLQMGMYVLLTIWLRQKGSSESKKLYEVEEVDREADPARDGAPWAVRAGPALRRLYSSSLSLMFFALFFASMWLHAEGGAEVETIERATRGEPPISCAEYMVTARFWFESLQNWQSEFVSILSIVGFSIFLRQKGSPESKPVDAAHGETED
jgi:uncharacterized protein DUF6766